MTRRKNHLTRHVFKPSSNKCELDPKSPSFYNIESRPVAMSSPASRRSQRNSLTSTPARSTRNSQLLGGGPTAISRQAPPPNHDIASTSPQADLQATPRASRQNVALSSPLFFRSSPANGVADANMNDGMNISSPLRKTSIAGSTPRGRPQAVGGI